MIQLYTVNFITYSVRKELQTVAASVYQVNLSVPPHEGALAPLVRAVSIS